MDAVQKVGNGHPGTAMSLAPAAYLVFQKLMRHNPADPNWAGPRPFRPVVRPLEPDAVHPAVPRRLRPRARRPRGAPYLGQPDAGSPRARPHRRCRDHDRPARPGRRQRRRDGDGGPPRARPVRPRRRRRRRACSTTTSTSSPATATSKRGSAPRRRSIAGHQQLGNLVLLYDDNKISIEDDTAIAFSEDVAKRYEAYGWHVQQVDWTNGGTGYEENVQALFEAYQAAKAETDRPSFIALRTIIAWPAPNAAEQRQGPRLGPRRRRGRGDQGGSRLRPRPLLRRGGRGHRAHPPVRDRGTQLQAAWQERYDAWAATAGDRVALYDRMRTRTLPARLGRRACPSSKPTRRVSPHGRRPARRSTRWSRRSPSSGAARPTSPDPTTRRPRASRASSRPSTRPRSSPATGTAECSTSASASTAWARS